MALRLPPATPDPATVVALTWVWNPQYAATVFPPIVDDGGAVRRDWLDELQALLSERQVDRKSVV